MPTSVANVVAKSATGLGSGGEFEPLPANVGEAERVASALGGAALLGYGLTCRGLLGVLLPLGGAALIFRGVTGSCGCYAALGINTNQDRSERTGVEATAGHKLVDSVTVNASPDETFRFWR